MNYAFIGFNRDIEKIYDFFNNTEQNAVIFFTFSKWVKRDDINVFLIDGEYNNYKLCNEALQYLKKNMDFIVRNSQRWKYHNLNYDDLSWWISKLFLNYVNNLKNNKVDIIINGSATPHHLYDFILYHASVFLGIKFYSLGYNFIEQRLMFLRGINEGVVSLKQKNFNNNLTVNYINQIQNSNDNTPPYMKNMVKNVKYNLPFYAIRLYLKKFIKQKINITLNKSVRPVFDNFFLPYSHQGFIETYKKAFLSLIKIRNLKKIYNSIARDVDYKEKYICFFAPYQPEGTSLPGANEQADIRFAVKTLIDSLPHDMTLIYREHPSTFKYILFNQPRYIHDHRSERFYLDLKEMGCRFATVDIPSKKIIRESALVATINGSISIEAPLDGKQAIYFGNSWFYDMPGAYKAVYGEDLYNLINKSKSTKLDVQSEIKDKLVWLSKNSMCNIFGMLNGRRKITEGSFKKFMNEILQLSK